jgi:hypothetical protein
MAGGAKKVAKYCVATVRLDERVARSRRTVGISMRDIQLGSSIANNSENQTVALLHQKIIERDREFTATQVNYRAVLGPRSIPGFRPVAAMASRPR